MQRLFIRPARPDDLGILLRLLGELGRPCGEDAQGLRRETSAAILQREDTHVFVADYLGQIAGAACLMLLPRLGYSSREARLLDLVVTDEVRGKGVGYALVETAIGAARREGCHLLRLECGHWRVDAQRFYRRLGFESKGEDWQLALDLPQSMTGRLRSS